MSQTNPKVTNIAIAAKAGAWTLIIGTILAGKVQVIEDPATNAGTQQGLTGYYLDPNATLSAAFLANPTLAVARANGYLANPNIQVWLPNGQGQSGQAFEPIIFGGADGRMHGELGGYSSAQGTGILMLTTNSGTAGGVLLVEYP